MAEFRGAERTKHVVIVAASQGQSDNFEHNSSG